MALWHENRILALNEGVSGDFADLGAIWAPGTLPGSVHWHKETFGTA